MFSGRRADGFSEMSVTHIFVASLFVAACGGQVSTSNEVCAAGTYDENGRCTPKGDAASSSSCEPGTSLENGACVPQLDGATSDGDSSIDSGFVDSGTVDSGVTDGGTVDASFVDTACLVTDNIFVLAGDDYIHSGPPLIIRGGAGWDVQIYALVNGLPSNINISIGQNWTAWFATRSLGIPLLPMTYTDAQRVPFEAPGHPAMDVSGDGRGCNMITGHFRVIEMNASASDGGMPVVKSFTATFEQHCEGGPRMNVGCVHVTQ